VSAPARPAVLDGPSRPVVMRRRAARRRLALLTDQSPAGRRLPVGPVDGPHATVFLICGTVLAGGVAGVFGGPVAALIAAGYGALGLRAARRAVAERAATAARTSALDVISGLAADLRAGLAPSGALGAARAAMSANGRDPAVRRALGRLVTAYEVSERLGAPLADLLERVESDLRTVERARAAVSAQTTGARATAALLALLPVAGVGLGYAMGARPGYALLHTPLGAACAVGALLLQCGGLIWTGRLCRAAVERAS
jgi:tight adherence protein B